MSAGAGKHDEAATESSSSRVMTRVHIGGLGDGVKESDVLKLFSPLGRVNCIDCIRSKGRAFAYVDFFPNSDKSLAKLFSSYNGCLWKGGRLRIETAKEHYLDRLKREWAEDVEPPGKPAFDDSREDPCSSIQSKHETNDKAQLHIFFPKLRKIKALPFKGTGKHKYSFQRVAVPLPSIPVHFCDCEEHSQLSEDRKVTVNEDEINMMNSVMNKLLAKQEAIGVSHAGGKDPSGNDGAHPDDKAQVIHDGEAVEGQDTVEAEDAENLVTNIGAKSTEDELLHLMQLKMRESLHGGVAGVAKERDKEKMQRGDKDDLPSISEKSEQLPRKVPRQDKDPAIMAHSPGSNYPPTEDLDMKSKPGQSSGPSEMADGASSWIQKSSWKELLGDSARSSTAFTISQILPGTFTVGHRSALSGGAVNPQSEEAKKRVPAGAAVDRARGGGESNLDADSGSGGGKKIEKAPSAVAFGFGQVHSFVRSRDSEKEWAKAKAALSGHLKRSRNVKAAPETSKSRRIAAP